MFDNKLRKRNDIMNLSKNMDLGMSGIMKEILNLYQSEDTGMKFFAQSELIGRQRNVR